MTSSRRFERLLQAGCLGLIGMLTAAGCGGSSSPPKDGAAPDGSADGVVQPIPGAQLTVNPPSVNFESIDVGVKSAPLAVTVTNAGATASGPLTVTVSGAGISATGCSGVSLPKGGTCQISVTVQAAVAGQISGMIEVGDAPAAMKKIAVSGVAITPGQFTLAPAPLDLGPVLAGKTASGIVVMTNTAPTGIADIVMNVSGAGFVAGTGTCTATLAVGQTCNIVVNFTAGTASGVARGALNVSQGGVTKTVALSATVQTPAKLVMTPTAATLQTVVGTPSSPVTFYVTNAGDVTSAIPTVAITGTNKDDFTFVSTCATALVGGATARCDVTVTYNPKAAPAVSSTATLTVAEPGTGGSSVAATLTGTANLPSDLVITGTATDFGTVVVGGASPALTFTLTNKGGVDSGLVKVSGAGQFSVVTDNCSDKSLAAAGACSFTATFKPAVGDAGVVQGQLKAVAANVANPAFLGVTGSAVPAAKLAIDQDSLEFGSLPTHQESAPKTLVISNVGGAPTGALKVENTGAQFQIKGDTCSGAVLTAAGAGATCSIIVTFTSTGTDVEATGSIIVSDTTGAGGSVKATLHGTGIAHAGLSMDPSVICPQFTADDPLCRQSATVTSIGTFKNKVLGQKTEELAIRITNTTPPTMAPDSGAISFQITGDAKGDFAIVQNNCTSLLSTFNGSTDNGTSCLVTLTFTPSAVGLRKATLVLSTTRGGASQTTLEGKGLPAFEIQPLQVMTGKDGLTFKQTSLGHNDGTNVLGYRAWLRSTTAADLTSTVTLTLPAATPADFVWSQGTTYLTIGGPGNLLTPPVPYGYDEWDAAEYFSYPIQVAGGETRVNPCHSKTVSMAIPAGGTKPVTNAGYTYDESSGYFYCDFAVQFYPNSDRGTLTAELNGNATNSGTGKLTLTGQAVGPLTINPSPLIVQETVAVGETLTTGLTLTVTNNGAATQTGLAFELGGTGAGDFQIEGTTCWTLDTLTKKHVLSDLFLDSDLYPQTKIDQLAQGESCLVWLGFRPQSELEYAVNVIVKSASGESATAVVRTTGLKSFGALSITPSPVQLADTPFNKEDAEPVVLTIKNNGSLDSGLVTLTITNTFEIVKETPLPAGACNVTGQWRVPGSGQCTIKVRAKPTTESLGTTPLNGIGKLQVIGTLTVDAAKPNTAGEATSVEVPLTYFVTSNLVVGEVGGALSSSVTYAFPSKGMTTPDSKHFTVRNVSSKDVTLTIANVPPFSVHIGDDIPGVTLCKTGVTLNAGGSCTLVIDDAHSQVGVVGSLKPVRIDVVETSRTDNFASVFLSSTTVTRSMLRSYGLTTETDPESGMAGYGSNGPEGAISMGTVPMRTGSRSGVMTLWFRNLGDTPTGELSALWMNDPEWSGIENYKAEDEFKVVAPAAENTKDCLSGSKILQPKEFCSIQVYFEPKSNYLVSVTRPAVLVLKDGDTPVDIGQGVWVYGDAVDPATGVWASVGTASGFFQFAGSTAQPGSAETAKTQIFVLNKPAASEIEMAIPTSDWFQRKTITGNDNECPANGDTWGAGDTACEFTIMFIPGPGSMRVFPYVGSEGPNLLGLMARVEQPTLLQFFPPAGMPLLTEPAGLDMLKIAMGGTTPAYTLTVVNTGDVATQALGLVEVGTPVAGDPTFEVSTGCQAKILQPYGSKNSSGVANDRCVVTVTAKAGSRASTVSEETGELEVIRNTLRVDYKSATAAAEDAAETAEYGVGVRVVTAAKLVVTGGGMFTNAVAVTGYEARTLTVVNEGQQASGIVEVPQPSGSGAAHFKVMGTSCPPNKGLELGDPECYVYVRFAPTALSAEDEGFGATLNVNATPGSAAPLSLTGTSKSALSVQQATGTPLKVVIDATGTSATTVLTVWNDITVGNAAQTSPLKTSLSGTEFTMIDDQCYGKMLKGNTSCTIQVKYIGAATNTEKTTTLTVDGGSVGQSVSVVVGYTGAAATTH